ncbi:rod shape-determining protein RodA [Macrococcus bovicus]|uniref:Rod shape-determining protein RodA n=1 Tax=Macrococcus bovicus TaxID=69968 RepID=A0A4R6BZF6_9STAP|nr:rod shape-determining protein RodA [Macrococcus bovicus]TDM13746.1 rod shape-determining protein RodA [Macrococcus bovicus]
MKQWLEKIDWWLLVLLIAFATVSITVITSAMAGQQYATNFAERQFLYYILGFIIALSLMFLSPKKLRQFVWPIYLVGNLALAGLFILPDSSFTPIINGAKSWYRLGPISLQPSEFMKVVLMLVLANVIYRHNRFTFNKTIQTDFNLILKVAAVALVPMILILLQNDLGTTLVLLAIILGMIIVSGISWQILVPFLLTIGAAGATLILSILYKPVLIEKGLGIQTYQLGRINSWLNPEAYSEGDGFHLIESMKAIGSGGLFGKGFKHGEVYIPENHTDFIYSVIGEEFGFIGSVLVLILFLALFIHLIRLAQYADHPFSSLFLTGLISMLMFHVFQNVGMTIQLVPITGIPLPLISYGGSALWTVMSGIGIALSIFYHKQKTSDS